MLPGIVRTFIQVLLNWMQSESFIVIFGFQYFYMIIIIISIIEGRREVEKYSKFIQL